MAGAYVIGGRLVSPEELDEKAAFGSLERLRSGSDVRFDAGRVRSRDILLTRDRPDFAPIGIGNPLGIEILTIYTGDAPRRFLGFLTGDPDLLVVSGARGVATTAAAPRAINLLVSEIEDCHHLVPDAFADGSPVVYYSPAEVNRTTLTSYELVVDSFDHKLFESMSKLFASAGGLPVFAPASSYLLAGSVAMNMFASLGKALIETDPFLRSRFNIRFQTPALEITQPKNVVLFNDEHADEFVGYSALPVSVGGREQMRLVHSQGQDEYSGPAPYIIASLDGRKRTDLEGFRAKHASAEHIEDFYAADGPSSVVAVLEDALELYNDMAFRRKADKLAASIGELDEGSAARAEAEKLLDAYRKNIRTDLLRPAKAAAAEGA